MYFEQLYIPDYDKQSLVAPQHLRELVTNRGPLYEQTNGLLEHVDFLHSNKQGNNVF